MSSINLEKGQKINLQKDGGGQLTGVMMGLGWDAATGFLGMGGGSIDLDASVAMYTEDKRLFDTVSFTQLRSRCGSITHSGDNLTGAGDGDDEKIFVDLHRVPTEVKSLVFTINSFRGQTFDKVKNCFARLVDTVSQKELFIYKLADKGSHTGMIMCKLYRHNGEWKAQAMGTPCNGQVISDISSEIVRCL